MATGLSGDTRVDMERGEISSLKTVDDCRLRLDKVAKLFNDPKKDTPNTVQLKITMIQLESLLLKGD